MRRERITPPAAAGARDREKDAGVSEEARSESGEGPLSGPGRLVRARFRAERSALAHGPVHDEGGNLRKPRVSEETGLRASEVTGPGSEA